MEFLSDNYNEHPIADDTVDKYLLSLAIDREFFNF